MHFYSKIYKEWMEKTQQEKIRKILKISKPYGKILDVGSGFGVLEKFIKAIAVDINEEYLKIVPSKHKIKASGDALPFKSNSFDFVFCIDTIHLLKSLKEIKRVLKRHGKLVVSIFCFAQNIEEKAEWLENIVKNSEMKIKHKFLVKTEKEWDFVIIAEKV
ncbi:MAG TPA: class I SAM-dependent methyltransferase [Nanoarchaeota archaeon]|nr:class I SAM-dependent methyltransferase [Nanoarchaeota archaeon]